MKSFLLRYGTLLAALFVLPICGARVEAQGRPGPGRGLPPGAAPQRRQQMEQQLRQRLWRIAKERAGLTDDQMTRLEATSRRFDERRRGLAQTERAQRLVLRQEILADSKADQQRISAALDRLHALQRERVDLQIEEQREFAQFMTPLQRAKYAALQEQFRRRVEQLRRARPDSGEFPGGRVPPR